MDPFIGEIRLIAFNYAPQGWFLCQGQLLPINQYVKLFSLLGTTFGGNGITTFALPNLQGRVAIGQGQGTNLAPRTIGDTGGAETVTLTTAQLPAHTHALNASSAAGTTATPANTVPAQSATGDNQYGAAANTTMSAGAIGQTGSGQPHENMPPFLALNYIICYEGIYPVRP